MLEIISQNIDSKINSTYVLPAVSCCKILNSSLNDTCDSIDLNEKKSLRLVFCDLNLRSVVFDVLDVLKT